MKRENIVTILAGFILACLLSFGAVGAMISGLQLPVDRMEDLYTAWIISAMAGCALFSFKKGWLPALLIAVLGLGYLWEYHYLSLPIRAMITRLSWIYDSAYHWGVLEFAGVNWRVIPLDLPLAVWGCLIALTAAGTVVGGRGLLLTILLALLPIGSTVVVTNTPPDSPYVFAVMLALILLVLPATVRRHSPQQGAKLTAMTALPVGLLLSLLFVAYPQDTYVNRSQEYLNEVVSWWQSNIATAWDTSGLLGQSVGVANETPTTNLSLIGPRANWRYPVMDVTTEVGGTLYLRGQDYDIYDGANWTASPDREEYYYATRNNGNTITISTRRNINVLYLPYYTAAITQLTGGRYANDEGLTEYSFQQAGTVRSTNTVVGTITEDDTATSILPGVSDIFLSLPEDTLEWATAYLEQHIPDVTNRGWFSVASSNVEYFYIDQKSNTEIAELIRDHVLTAATYDTDTPRMSGEYDDFAQWFLEESDRGYCVHFATVAAVLLRAADVPARYVTGYMFQAGAGETTTVRADRAHAWVEYYEPLVGNWVILEATPPDLEETETEPSEAAEATEATEPPAEETTAPPTEAEDQTRPADNTIQPGDQEDPKLDLTPLWTVLRWLLAPLGLWLLVLAQYALRRGLRRHRRSPNARALAKWQEVELLCRVAKQELPEELEQLAQKAKFSQHTLTAEELHAFDAWLTAERDKPMPWYLRFICRYVLALW